MKWIQPEVRTTARTVALHGALTQRAREGHAWISASVCSEPAVVLGRNQRAGRVLDLEACAARGITVYRRATSGTAAFVDDPALFFALALPRVDAVMHDARPNTILNRYVRGFLQAFNRAGAHAQYFGREWMAVTRRPAALLGIELDETGGVLVEVIAGIRSSMATPDEMLSALERTRDPWRGHAPLAMEGWLTAPGGLPDLASRLCAAVAERLGDTLETKPEEIESDAIAPAVTAASDPVGEADRAGEPVACPIGFVEAARRADGTLWLGGDALIGTAGLAALTQAIESGESDPAPPAELQGARVEDFVNAAKNAAT